MNHKTHPILFFAEFLTLFILIPVLLFVGGARIEIYLSVWFAGFYAFFMLRRAPDFSYKKLWHGVGWTKSGQYRALLRFFLLAGLIALLTLIFLPQKFMRFPLDRFPLWLTIMVFYPLLSVVPQELFFRSFFFMRYGDAFAENPFGLLINGFLFGFSHIVLNNWIAPAFCFVGGVILAHSYRQHRSLKWAIIEHSLYGCWIFTIGFGWYFFTGNWRG